MRPHKTELARQTLDTHGRVLGMRERRLLILCDGHRNIADLKHLFGEDAAPLVAHMVAAGYLAMGQPPGPASPAPVPPQARTPPTAEPALHTTAPPPASSIPRRSLVAAKVYLVGVLELQRDEQAAAHRQHLQSRLDEPALFEAMADALAFLQTRVAPSFVARVHARLIEALPEEDIHRLQLATVD